MARETIKLKIVTPKEIFYDDFVDVFTIKTIEGFTGLMKGHIPFISLIKPCRFEIRGTNNKIQQVAISNGIVFTDGDIVQVITNDIIRLGKDSLAQAKKDLENLKGELKRAEEQSAQYMSIDGKIQDKIKEIKLIEK